MGSDLTAEQRLNRARAVLVFRVVSGLLALGTAATLWNSLRDGRLTLGVGDRRGPGGESVVIGGPIGVALGVLFLEALAVYFAIFALNPRWAMSAKVLVPSLGAVLLLSIVLRLFTA